VCAANVASALLLTACGLVWLALRHARGAATAQPRSQVCISTLRESPSCADLLRIPVNALRNGLHERFPLTKIKLSRRCCATLSG